MKTKKDLKFWIQNQVKQNVPVFQARRRGPIAPWPLQEVFCLITGAVAMYTTANKLTSEDPATFMLAMGGAVAGAIVTTAITCCILPCAIPLAFGKYPTVDIEQVKEQVKLSLKQALEDKELSFDESEFEKYFDKSKENFSKNSFSKNFENLINGAEVQKLIEEIAETLENDASEITPLVSSGNVQHV